ncbi:MAG: LacI family transcriptional regulator [Lachnospiraceae bacterium]|nr:LacI family transcriptional regulator [Lachnospiraceae bacterium]
MAKHSRKTIGLLVTGVTDAYAEALCRGVTKAANNIRMNVVVVPGKYINRDTLDLGPLKYEYQYTSLYSYIKETNMDALIISAGSIGAFTSESKLMEFLAQYVHIPIILVSSNYEGFRSVSYDNEVGIRNGLVYMIKELKCKHICMLGGPDGNTDVLERRNAFIKVMDEYGMELGEYSYIPGLLSGDNREACTTLIECNPEMDGVFCVNDYAALSLYEEMKARDLVPGVDIQIFGYDNTVEGAKADPPLSTISADPVVLGSKAVSAVLRTLGGEAFTTEKLDAQFVVRRSMGQKVSDDTFDGQRFLNEMSSDQIFDMVFYRYRRSGQDTATTSVYSTWTHLIDCFSDLSSISISDDAIDDEIRTSYHRFIDSGALDYADINQLLSYFQQLEKTANANKTIDARERVYRLMQEFYVDVARRMDTQVGIAREQQVENVESIKQFVIDSMAVHSDDVANYESMLISLNHLGVNNAYMYMLDKPVKYGVGESFATPESMKLIAAMTDKNIVKLEADKEVSIDDLFDNETMKESPHKFVVVPLFVEEVNYGMLVCDLSDSMYAYEEFLSSHVSNMIGRMVYKADR